MRGIRNASFVILLALFALSPRLAPRAAAATLDCDCTLEDYGDDWGFYDCYSDSYCDASKVACGLALCGEDRVNWEETYCGNQNLLVTCTERIPD